MVYVIGEALIDLVQQPGTAGSYRAHAGGSPYNVAIGLARLGQPSRLLARLSSDAFGRQLRAHAEANQVELSLAVAADESSTLAVISLDDDRNATYDFYRIGTADWQWSATELDRLPAEADWVHAGSIASWTDPGATAIEARLAACRPGTVISYDPNIRPALLADRADGVARVQRLVSLSTVVKASAEDLAWLYPDLSVAEVLHRWQASGPTVVVVTDGGKGAQAMVAGGQPFTVNAIPVEVVDTVGAGDAFMAGLINALSRAGTLSRPDTDSVRVAVAEAILVAALTCSRAGANPPTAAELASAASRPG